MTAPVVFVDTETFGLDPERHAVFEIGLIVGDEEWNVWIVDAPVAGADPGALRVNRYYQRQPTLEEMNGAQGLAGMSVSPGASRLLLSRRAAAHLVARKTAGHHLVGAVPSFDARMLEVLLVREQLVPAWHYHLVDVEVLAAGRLGLAPPWRSYDLYRKLGVDPDAFEQHTALGDARMARAVYQAVMHPPEDRQ